MRRMHSSTGPIMTPGRWNELPHGRMPAPMQIFSFTSPRRWNATPHSQMDKRESHHGAVGAAAVTFEVGVPVITLTGEIDVSNVDLLRATIEPAIETAPERVVFDLTGLEFMDSSGVALLLHAATRAGSVHLRRPSSIVRRIIEITGLTDVLHIDA